MSQVKISIVIPVYNASKYIECTLNHIKKSITSSFEIILVDDYSSDDTVNKISACTENDENVKLITLTNNGGPGIARDVGLSNASGEYTVFFDSDDIMKKGVLDRIVFYLDAHGIDVAITKYEVAFGREKKIQPMWENDQAIFKKAIETYGEVIEPKTFPEIITITNYPWNKVCRTSYLRKNAVCFGALRLHEDIYPHWLIIMNAEKVFVSKEIFCSYVLDPEGHNVTNNNSELRMQCIDAAEEVLKKLGSNKSFVNYENEFWFFAADVISWAYSIIADAHKPDFEIKANLFFKKIRFKVLQNIYHKNLYLHKNVCDFLMMKQGN
ncbi:glycosyltransferase [Pantoea dispersa]|uniref:glycosyltransferase family 2 protein n=1 Tax=Pantoea dispersa TaxID=59814 RepID=UPI0021AFF7A7|nr:glycosyltransferase family 2 protein [Pantoea dispersa]MCT6588734.1 glycosyltransferase [Pantoea dispersa]